MRGLILHYTRLGGKLATTYVAIIATYVVDNATVSIANEGLKQGIIRFLQLARFLQ